MQWIDSTDVREEAIQAARSWAKRVLNLTDDQVIPQAYGRDDVPPPAPPYIVVSFREGTTVGVDEDFEEQQPDGSVLQYTQGFRRGTLRLEAVGAIGYQYLEQLRLRTDAWYPVPNPPSVPEGSPGFSIGRALSGIIETPSYEHQQWEQRFIIDYEIPYGVRISYTSPKIPATSFAPTYPLNP